MVESGTKGHENTKKWSKRVRVYKMFYGEYQHSLDIKGRIIIPSVFREELGTNFIITKGLDDCLFIYSKEEWKNLETKIKQLPLTDINARRFVRFFFAGACEASGDKQGRVLIPQNLREYACLDKEIYICGVSSRVEIWSKQKYEDFVNGDGMSAQDIAQNLSDLGINI